MLDKRLEALNKRGKIYNTEQEQKEFQEKYKKVWKPFSLFSERKVDEVKTRKNRMTTKEEIQKVRNKYVLRGVEYFFYIYDVILMYIIYKANIFSNFLMDFSDLIYFYI